MGRRTYAFRFGKQHRFGTYQDLQLCGSGSMTTMSQGGAGADNRSASAVSDIDELNAKYERKLKSRVEKVLT